MGRAIRTYSARRTASGAVRTDTDRAMRQRRSRPIELGDVITNRAFAIRMHHGTKTEKPHLKKIGKWWRCKGPNLDGYGPSPIIAYSNHERWNNLIKLAAFARGV